MLQLNYYSFNLEFEYPFTISKGTKTFQPTLIVALSLGGITGYGEASAISYYSVTVDEMINKLEEKRGIIEKYALTDPHRFWHFLHHLLPGQNFLIAALDIAAWDLFSKMRRTSLHQLLKINWKPPITDYTIGIDSFEKMSEKIKAKPWPVYKIKMRSPDEIDTLKRLRKITASPFRVDANEAWNLQDAKRLLPELKALGVILLEQPLPKENFEETKALKELLPVDIFADEACREEKDVKKCADAYNGINIKLTKCGGITPALRMIAEARQLDLKVMLGSMNESSIGTAAIVQISALADFMDADGPLLLSEDVAEGLTYKDDGTIEVNGPGLGIKFVGKKFQKNLSA